jgi:hypothetical protein
MRNLLKSLTLFVMLLFLPPLIFSQSIDLGVLSSFEAYTGSGACTNAGTFTGDVGTNNGIIVGFVAPAFTGLIYNNNATTLQARIDILRLYIQLNDIFVTYPGTHAASFGSGEIITPGVYSIDGAGSLAGTITLDGGGDANAVFIIKFLGAFTAGAGSTIILSNGTQACNVFWMAEGAIDIADGSDIKGTLFSHPGAITLAVNCTLEGRMFASEGAITNGAGSVAIAPACTSTIQVNCFCTCEPVAAVDVLGSAENFAIFTSDGDVSNSASSGIIGDIGTDLGAITGFSTSTHVGANQIANAITSQANIDLNNAYNQLILLTVTVPGHAPAFGSGETLNAGVYFIGAGAGSLAGTVILDGQGDPDAIFVFRFNGAFTVAALAKVVLINGARRCNIFWISEGAISMGAYASMKGSIIANQGANTIGAGGFIDGRMLSTAGAIVFSTGVIFNDPLCPGCPPPVLPIELLSFTASIQDAHVELNWVTASENNNDYFNVERSADGMNFTSIITVDGAGNSAEMLSYSTLDAAPLVSNSYYRLKQTDYDGETSYSQLAAVQFNEYSLAIYPNPFSVETVFYTTEKLIDAKLIVYNSYGRVVKQIENICGQTFTLARENLSRGLYFISLVQNSKILATEKLVIAD